MRLQLLLCLGLLQSGLQSVCRADAGVSVSRLHRTLAHTPRNPPFQPDCVLEPGQMLFIPPGWWHYVRSTTVSFSVSFWWR